MGSKPITRRSLPAIVAGIVIGVGAEAAALKTRAAEASNDPADISMGGPFTDVLSASLAVPGSGQLIAEASAGMLGVGASSGGCRFRLGGTTMGQELSFSIDGNLPVPLLARAAVGAATHTVTIECREAAGTSGTRGAPWSCCSSRTESSGDLGTRGTHSPDAWLSASAPPTISMSSVVISD